MKNIELTSPQTEHGEDIQNAEYIKEHHRLEKAREHAATEYERDKEAASYEKARSDALEKASSIEKRPSAPLPEIVKRPTKKSKEQSFQAAMDDTRRHMSPIERSFSRVIHNKTVEKVSEVTAKTIARPNAIASGAIFAFLFTLLIYIIAKKYGYPLSGFETIGAFILGWSVGIAYDLIRAMVQGRSDS